MNSIYFDRLDEALMGRVFSRVRTCASRWPRYLCHYTNERGLRGILSQGRVRAFSADSQTKDKEEIAYGCTLLAKLIEKKLASIRVSTLTRRILNELKWLPKQRSRKVFLASFCEMEDYRKLWNEFGQYSLRFVVNSPPRVFISVPYGLATGQGFRTELLPAIYDTEAQEIELASLLDSLIETLKDPSLIQLSDSGLWADTLVRLIALTLSDQALSLITRLKDKKFSREEEWRVVVRPDHTRFSSDPEEADRNCECYIKGESRRYVELSAAEPEARLIPAVVFGLPTSPLTLPIDAVRIGPCKTGNDMARLARRLLDKHLATANVLRSELSPPPD